MSEEQQAVLDESQETDGLDSQQAETLETTEENSQAESATAEDTTTEQSAEPSNVEKRINKLTAEKYGKDRKIEEKDRKIRELEARLGTGEETQQSKQPTGKPTLEQFDYDQDAYNEAMIDYHVQQQLDKRETAAQKAQREQADRQREAAYDKQEIEYVTENPSYVDDIQALPMFPVDTLNVIKGQENAPSLVHYLAKNPSVAEQIAQLDTMSAAVQIGMIAAKNSAQVKTVKTSAAPDPIDPIKPGGSSMSDNVSPHVKGATFE